MTMQVLLWGGAVASMLCAGRAVRRGDAPMSALFGAMFGINLVALAIGQAIQ